MHTAEDNISDIGDGCKQEMDRGNAKGAAFENLRKGISKGEVKSIWFWLAQSCITQSAIQ